VVHYQYLTCPGRLSENARDGAEPCSFVHVRADVADDRLWAMLVGFLTDPAGWGHSQIIEWATQQADAVDVDDLQAELDGLTAQITTHKANKAKWLDLFGEDLIDKAELLRRSKADAAAIEQLDGQASTVSRKLAAADTRQADLAAVRQMMEQYGKGIAAAADDLRDQLNSLGWHERRLLLHRLLDGTEIRLGLADAEWPAPERKGAKLAKPDDGHNDLRLTVYDAVQAGIMEFKRSLLVQPAQGDRSAVAVRGLELPIRPHVIADALAAVGITPALAPKACKVGTTCARRRPSRSTRGTW